MCIKEPPNKKEHKISAQCSPSISRSFSMASSISSVAISGGLPLQKRDYLSTRSSLYGNSLPQTFRGKSYQKRTNRSLSVCARYDDNSGVEFLAGFLVGGAIFGALGYVYAPQLRRSLLNEDEFGFQRARRPIYYDEGLEKTRQTLNSKIRQLNSAIDNVSTRLRGKNKPPVPVEIETDESII